MNKEVIKDQLRKYCKDLNIRVDSYFCTFKVDKDTEKNQKSMLNKMLNKDQDFVGVLEWAYTKKCEGYHYHLMSNEPLVNASNVKKIYDLEGLIDYLAKQIIIINEKIILNIAAKKNLKIEKDKPELEASISNNAVGLPNFITKIMTPFKKAFFKFEKQIFFLKPKLYSIKRKKGLLNPFILSFVLLIEFVNQSS